MFILLADSQYEKASSQYVKQENEMRQTRMFNVLLGCKQILCNCIIYETQVTSLHPKTNLFKLVKTNFVLPSELHNMLRIVKICRT